MDQNPEIIHTKGTRISYVCKDSQGYYVFVSFLENYNQARPTYVHKLYY
jgi:hypothetical protein